MTDTATHAAEKPKRRHRSPHGPGQFVTDNELIEWLGLPLKDGKMMLLALDQNPASRFPKKDAFWGGRRYLPAVETWLQATKGLKMDLPQRRSA